MLSLIAPIHAVSDKKNIWIPAIVASVLNSMLRPFADLNPGSGRCWLIGLVQNKPRCNFRLSVYDYGISVSTAGREHPSLLIIALLIWLLRGFMVVS
jgi:hypothetical protein